VKARRVKGLDPDGALADNAERIVRVRLDELCGFMPAAADPAEVVAQLQADDAAALHAAAGDADDLDPALLKQAPHAREHAGLAALQSHLRARRLLLFDRFLELWGDYERKGFRARLEYAVAERSGVSIGAP
jgi:hypothetical protein